MTDLVKEKSSVITLEELRRSVDETTILQKPINGIRHIDLIDQIMELVTYANLDPVITDITIQNGGLSRLPGISILPIFEKEFGSNDTRSMIIRRMYAKILFMEKMKKGEKPEQIMGLAFTYTQDGICIAIGPNVQVCSNWSIYYADQFATTYQNELKVPASKLVQIVAGWMELYPSIKETTMGMSEKMKSIPFEDIMAEHFFGRLHMLRVASDKNFISLPYPMTQGQINTFTEDYLAWTADHVEQPTLWDFYNIGTNILKPKTVELPQLLPQSLRLGSAITEFFQLN